MTAQNETQQNTSARRLPPYRSLDFWRGIASLWVMLFHAEAVMKHQYAGSSGNPVYRFSAFGQLGVQMFFVISGYCIAAAAASSLQRDHGPVAFAQARLRRIFPTYWAAMVLTAALSLAAGFAVSAHLVHSSVLADLNLTAQSPQWFLANVTLTAILFHHSLLVMQAWTLCYEAFFYLAMGLFLGLATIRKCEQSLLLFAHVLTLAILAFLIKQPGVLNYPFNLWSEFGFGVMAYQCIRFPKKALSWLVLTAAGVETAIAIAQHNILFGPIQQSLRVQYGGAFLFAVLLIVVHRWDEWITTRNVLRPVAAVGVYSYSLYLTHTFSIGIINQLVKVLHLPASANFVYFVLMGVGAIIFARVFFTYCEKPFLSASGRARSANVLGEQPMATGTAPVTAE